MAVTDRDELWEVQCVNEYIVETDHVHKISFSLAKPGKAMPGPYSSLMVLRRRRSGRGGLRVPEKDGFTWAVGDLLSTQTTLCRDPLIYG